MAQKLFYFCVSAVMAIAFFSLGMLASHEKQEVFRFDRPVTSNTPSFVPEEEVNEDPTEEVAGSDASLGDYVIPDSDRYSEAYSIFTQAWSETVASKVPQIYALEKFKDLPKSCNTAWKSFLKGQSAITKEITGKFANLGVDFLEKLDQLIVQRSERAVEDFKENARRESESEKEKLYESRLETETQLCENFLEKAIAAGKFSRSDDFKVSAKRRNLGPKPEEIVILSASDYSDHGDFRWRLHQEALENRDVYAKYHGYRHVFLNLSRYDAAKAHVAHPCWLKLPAIQEVFFRYPQTKWVWWLDMDAIIWDGSKKLEDHILHPDVLARRVVPDFPVSDIDLHFYEGSKTPPEGEFDVEGTQFIFSPDVQTLNAGSFFIRNTPMAKSMLEFWGDPEYIYNEKHEIKYTLKEQDAFVKLYMRHKAFRDATAVVPQILFNAYGPDDSYESRRAVEGDLVVHFAGRSSHDTFYEIWDEVMNTRTLPNGEKANPSHEYPAKWRELNN